MCVLVSLDAHYTMHSTHYSHARMQASTHNHAPVQTMLNYMCVCVCVCVCVYTHICRNYLAKNTTGTTMPVSIDIIMQEEEDGEEEEEKGTPLRQDDLLEV